MERDNKFAAEGAAMTAMLCDEKMAEVDFDKLREWLGQSSTALHRATRSTEELQLLRSDFIDRISGMRKAIAAVNKRSDRMDELLQYLEGLSKLSAGDLIRQYRVTSAKFRDCFPASFGLLRSSGKSMRTAGDLKVYK